MLGIDDGESLPARFNSTGSKFNKKRTLI